MCWAGYLDAARRGHPTAELSGGSAVVSAFAALRRRKFPPSFSAWLCKIISHGCSNLCIDIHLENGRDL